MTDRSERTKQIKFKAVAFLAKRERSRLGLFKKLKEQFSEEGDAELINSVLDELEQNKYLSDERFARFRVLTRSSRYGDKRLSWELSRENVDPEVVKEVISANEVPEFDRAKAIWDRKFGELPDNPKEKARQIRFLASRGFSFKTIEKIMRGSADDDY